MNDNETRAQLNRAVALHGAAVASLNPDGSVSISVPVNDLERAREKRKAAKQKWRGVTNELVVSHANPDCKDCSGHGFTGPEEAGDVCKCADELFAIAYKGRLRWNESKRRVEVLV